MTDPPELDAGSLTAWFAEIGAALAGSGDADVACGSCTACCTASQFVHIGPDETEALAHIPAAVRFPAPGLPAGHVLLGYDQHGRCPMLGEQGCTIYAHRPRTCRTYDCRVFAATGLRPDEPGKAAIAEQSERWRFAVDSPEAAATLEAARAAATWFRERAATLPEEIRPSTTTQLAVLAIAGHDLFLGADSTGPEPEAVVAELVRRRRGPG